VEKGDSIAERAFVKTRLLPTGDAPHVILYDGVCGLCHRAVRFFLRHDHGEQFRFAQLQGAFAREALSRHGARADDLDTFWVVRDAGTARESALSRSQAVLFALSQLGLPWRALGLLATVPRCALDVAYDAFARSRYRLFGRYDRCVRPPEGFERRFELDASEADSVASDRAAARSVAV
jgi:predicted DCC family thiol-disulfide oxidoreductase YuxK